MYTTHAVKDDPEPDATKNRATKAIMAHHQLPDFEEGKDKWTPYLIKVEAYFEANAIEDSTKKRALLVAALSTHTIQVLAGKVAPRKPNALTYEEVVAVLSEHYDPKRHEITESYKFFSRCQAEGEPINEFLVDIRRIADNCNFGSALNRMLRDRIVCGVQSKALQKQLLVKQELTLEDTEVMVLSAEAADSGVKNMKGSALAPVLKVEAYQQKTPQDERRSAARQECSRCGSAKHNETCCTWSNARCYRCGGRGHLARKCRSRGAREQGTARRAQTNILTGMEGSTDDEHEAAHIWTLASERKSCLVPPIRRTFSWCGVQLTMEVDTGSPVCVIPRQLYETHRDQWPKLRPSSVKLSCCSGRLPVLGEIALSVSHKGATVECALTVLDCAGPSLCGRDLIQLLNVAGVPVVCVAGVSEPTEQTGKSSVNSIFNDFHDVFSEELGLITGPPVSLHLKEGAVPKFCREFTLVTDHQPLLGLLRSDRQTPTMAAARIQRWALQLGAYRYQLQYAPGRQMLNADALSRLPLQTTETEDDGEPLEYVLSLNQLKGGAVTTRELKAFTASDPVLVEVKRYILQGWPRHANGLARDILPFFDRKLELSVAHDLVYWGNRVIIPAKARVPVLQLLHETHQGLPAMKSVARSLFWWPGLDRNIEEVSAQCQNCVQNLPMPTAAPVVKWPETGERWSRIHIDYAGPICGKMILVVVDAHTKWLEAVPLSHASTETTINCVRGIFSRFGIPRTIVSDNGTQFSSHDFEEFVANNNIVHLRCAPYHPQSNGAAERAVRTIKDRLRKMRRGKLEENLIRLLFN
ncbi:uncharacterized protein LOC119384143 [Rhipicephalus sanguineus]|uniref:uncharacterized protein LOC119384143 n=1 Tax=Rhipicephalus sanguineus TaxID=34632 RepID=UPI0020C405B7|nr:uncharacterized protein LOC119384143 [Rhipicephalus sanguineus]